MSVLLYNFSRLLPILETLDSVRNSRRFRYARIIKLLPKVKRKMQESVRSWQEYQRILQLVNYSLETGASNQ